MKKLYFILILFAIPCISYAQYWQKAELPTGYNNTLYLDVYFLKSNPNFGWVCGFDGKVLRTTDHGKTWYGATIPAADHLESIHFANSSFGMTSGPAGVFRSTNGGQTWTNITPDISGRYWGSFVVDQNFAILVGGGCVGNQEFRYTTDGGDNWILTTKSVENSGLTDVKIIQPNGLGFAASSGMVWITQDGGITWDPFSNSGTNIWQEEISYSGGSFLVPYAGNSCQGGGVGGGMRFSSDYGQSWQQHSIGIPMYGSYLISSTEGWGCGVDREVVHTTDAGQSWQLKNCGIDAGDDLDDIWLINSYDGFVVGNGVYKLSEPKAEIKPTFIFNEQYCVNEIRVDTVLIKNYSFENEDINIELIGNNDGVFSIINPTSQNFTMLGCDRKSVIIQTSAQTSGTYNAQLIITYKPGSGKSEQIFTVDLEAVIIESTAKPDTNEIIIDELYCNTLESSNINWSCINSNEFITDIIKLNDNDQFSFGENLPVEISPASEKIKYNIVLSDTGWHEETFLHKLSPCDEEEEITFKVYGVSSIINGPEEFNFSTECSEIILDSIPITNTGNYKLIIDDVYFVENNTDITILGWNSKVVEQNIDINETKYLKLRYDAKKSGTNSYTLRFVNNDSTKINGNKNPFDVDINTFNDNIELSAKDTVIYLDSVCIGENSSKSVKIYNRGSDYATLAKPSLKDGFTLFSINQFPLTINPFDSVTFTVLYTPDKPGLATDTLVMNAQPCGRSVTLIIHGFGLEADIYPIPDNISKVIQSLELAKESITIENESNINLTISDIRIVPLPDNIEITTLPETPFELMPEESFELTVTFLAHTDTTYKGNIIIDAKGKCDGYIDIPLDIVSQSRLVQYHPDKIDFGIHYCEFPNISDSITIENAGVRNDTITSIEIIPASESFSISIDEMPVFLDSNYVIPIHFHPISEGEFATEIIIQTKEPNGQTLIIPVSGEFYRSDVQLLDEPETELTITEHCDDTLLFRFEFYNDGMIGDTLLASDNSQYPEFFIINDVIPIGSKESVFFECFIVPSEITELGIHEHSILISSLVCDYEFNLLIPIEKIQPEISISPDFIEISGLWKEDIASETLFLENNSNYDITIIDIYTELSQPEITIESESDFILPAGSSIDIPISYTATNEGDLSNRIYVIYQRNCPDTILADIKINVEEETYPVDLYISEYEAQPGERISIDLILNNSVYKFYPLRTKLGIEFNQRLFYPENVYVHTNGKKEELNYNVNGNILSVDVSESISTDLFREAGTIMSISGIVLAYIPNETELIIQTPEFQPQDMPVTFTKEDGLLKVTDFCELEANIRRFVPVGFESQIKSVSNDNIIVQVVTNDNIEIKVEVIDITGSILKTENYKFDNGNHTINIYAGDLSSGVYHLRIIGNKQIHNNKIMLLK